MTIRRRFLTVIAASLFILAVQQVVQSASAQIGSQCGYTLSAVSTYETDLAVLGREDFWLIVAIRGSEDETEIHSG